MPDNPSFSTDQTAENSTQAGTSTKSDYANQTHSTETDSSADSLSIHQYLTQAIHSLDLLNSQLGVAGAALVNLYHLQRQKEAAQAAPPPGYLPAQAGAPYPYPPQAAPPYSPQYQQPPQQPPQGYYPPQPPTQSYAPPGGAPSGPAPYGGGSGAPQSQPQTPPAYYQPSTNPNPTQQHN